MKRSILIFAVCALCASLPLFAATYDNNEYQRKSRAYSDLATKAYDDGDYDAAVEYARQAEENASLSVAFIEKMLARADSQTLLYTAHTRLSWAKEKKADKFFPAAFDAATAAVASGDELFTAENYADAKEQAQVALDQLAIVREIIPLPEFYKVTRWHSSRDCLWNIAKNPAVYGDPLLWDELYQANKKALKRPSDPDLLAPGMIVRIPSIKGEYREGLYDPTIKYESFKSQVK